MSINKKSEENEKLKHTLLTALNKMNSSSTIKVCHDTIKRLIEEEEKNENKINYILSGISEYINSSLKSDKKESIKLVSRACSAFKDASAYLSRLLTIIQTNITDENSAIFTVIATTFGEIVDLSMNNTEEQVKVNYELLQGFCIYNMKMEKKANQICGSLCLTSLIENSALVLEPAYMKYIWENIIYFMDRNTFNAKSELINSLISLIFASENLFKPFATVTLYKILDYLTDIDWMKRKLALNVVYTLVIYAQDEILPLKSHIVEFLKVLKCDKVKEVREVCMQTLKLLNNNEEEEKNTFDDKDFLDKNEMILNTDNDELAESARGKPNERNKEKVEDSSYYAKETKKITKFKNSPKKIENEISNIEKKSVNNSRLDFDASNINDLIAVNDSLFEDQKKVANSSKLNAKNQLQKKSTSNKNVKVQVKAEVPKLNKNSTATRNNIQKVGQTKIVNPYLNTLNKNSEKPAVENLVSNVSSNKKEAMLKKNIDNTMGNSRLPIKRDSIFKSKANNDFFSKAKNGEIQVLFKETNKINNKNKHSFANDDSYINYEVNNEIAENQEFIVNIENSPDLISTIQSKLEEKQNDITIKKNEEMAEDNKEEKLEEKVDEKTNKSCQSSADAESIKKVEAIATEPITNNFLKLSKLKIAEEIENKKNENFIHIKKFETTQQQPLTKKKNLEQSSLSSNNSNVQTLNKLEMSEVLKQMKTISEKQIFLVDTIEKTQINSKEQFEAMTNRIIYLENTVSQLLSIIKSNNSQNILQQQQQNYSSKNNNNTSQGFSSNNSSSKSGNISQPTNTSTKNSKSPYFSKRYESSVHKIEEEQNDVLEDSLIEDTNVHEYENKYLKTKSKNSKENSYQTNKDGKLTEIFMHLKNKNPNEAFNIALNCPDESNLLKLVEKINVSQINETEFNILEDAVIRTVSLLLRGENTNIIIPFLKNAVVLVDINLKPSLIQNIRDILLHIPKNTQKFKLSNLEMVDLNLILSHINSKTSRIKGYSSIIQSFSNND